MFMSVADTRRPLTKPGTTAIMVTNQCRFDLFAISLLSLLLRTDVDYLAGVIVIICGPGTNEAQPLHDKKHNFLQELARTQVRGRLLPLTIFRFYGPGNTLTHSNCLDAAMPFVFTEHTLVMHDDVIVRDVSWADQVKAALQDEKVGMVACPHLLMCRCEETFPPDNPAERTLLVPHPNSCFLSIRTNLYFSLWTRWQAYRCPLPVPQSALQLCKNDQASLDDMERFYVEHGAPMNASVRDPNKPPFVVVGQDVGAWFLHQLWSTGYKAVEINPTLIDHVVSASWHHADAVDAKLKNQFAEALNSAESEVGKEPKLLALYKQYCAKS